MGKGQNFKVTTLAGSCMYSKGRVQVLATGAGEEMVEMVNSLLNVVYTFPILDKGRRGSFDFMWHV